MLWPGYLDHGHQRPFLQQGQEVETYQGKLGPETTVQLIFPVSLEDAVEREDDGVRRSSSILSAEGHQGNQQTANPGAAAMQPPHQTHGRRFRVETRHHLNVHRQDGDAETIEGTAASRSGVEDAE